MKFKVMYEIEINEGFGTAYLGREVRKHLEDINADNDAKALREAERRKFEISKQYIGAGNCRIFDIIAA